MHRTKEQARLETLRRYGILDTTADRLFDELTKLAAKICKTPISAISLVDDHRQWFLSKTGLDADETPVEQAFCAHTIKTAEPFIVEDAALDARFDDNALVTGSPNIRFYAGLPLIVENGAALGSLCVIDREPRQLTDDQLDMLKTLQLAVVSHIELKRAIQEMAAVQSLLPMCSWCHQIRTGDDPTNANSWVELKDYVEGSEPVTHGICPECFNIEKQRQR